MLALDDHHGFTVDVLVVAADAEFLHQPVDRVLTWPDPGATPPVDPDAFGAFDSECAPADTVPGFEKGHRSARLFESQGGSQSSETCADHAEIHISHGLWCACLCSSCG